jgi:hypothetical protein
MITCHSGKTEIILKMSRSTTTVVANSLVYVMARISIVVVGSFPKALAIETFSLARQIGG